MLTKEQIEELETYAPHLCGDLPDWFNSTYPELLRGYRAWLAEVEHHEAELLMCAAKIISWGKKRNRALAEHFEQNANYHRARLSALQKGAE